jgi:hypothetical protein
MEIFELSYKDTFYFDFFANIFKKLSYSFFFFNLLSFLFE